MTKLLIFRITLFPSLFVLFTRMYGPQFQCPENVNEIKAIYANRDNYTQEERKDLMNNDLKEITVKDKKCF